MVTIGFGWLEFLQIFFWIPWNYIYLVPETSTLKMVVSIGWCQVIEGCFTKHPSKTCRLGYQENVNFYGSMWISKNWARNQQTFSWFRPFAYVQKSDLHTTRQTQGMQICRICACWIALRFCSRPMFQMVLGGWDFDIWLKQMESFKFKAIAR